MEDPIILTRTMEDILQDIAKTKKKIVDLEMMLKVFEYQLSKVTGAQLTRIEFNGTLGVEKK